MIFVSEVGLDKNGHRLATYKCCCGNAITCRIYRANKGIVKSCGCSRRKHGEGKGNTPEYRAWQQLKQRCLNSKHADFPSYGGRGILVCARWLDSYTNFLADMGRKPSPAHSLDRIDNNGNYEPDNVRWATWTEQRLNQRRSSASQHA